MSSLTVSTESRSSRKVADSVLTLQVQQLCDCQRDSTGHMQGTDQCEGKGNEFRRRQTKSVLFAVFTSKAA
jgi:hypothetical protein